MAESGIYTYLKREQAIVVRLAGLKLTTRESIKKVFDDAVDFWRKHAGGQKVYWVIGYDGVTFDPKWSDFYQTQVKRGLEHYAVTIVRYSSDPLMRTHMRVINMKLHQPSHFYANEEDALHVVRALIGGEATIG